MVKEIRRLNAEGFYAAAIAKRLKVKTKTVSKVLKGKTWADIN